MSTAIDLLPVDAVHARLRSLGHSHATERVVLSAAHGRVLAQPVMARRASPAYDTAAMDGYAVRHGDLSAARALTIAGASYAGAGFPRAMREGEAVRIATGAALPAGADRVIPREDACVAEDRLLVRSVSARDHVRRCGSDFATGDVLIDASEKLSPQRLVSLAAADYGQVEVYARPRVAIIAMGDELRAPGAAGAALVPDSLSHAIAAFAAAWGADVTGLYRGRDDIDGLRDLAAVALAEADIVVTIGGASVGDKDFARRMFEPHGLNTIVPKVAIKPGKPFWLGEAQGVCVVGLPGNPTAALITARLFLAPLLALKSGRAIEGALAWRQRAVLNHVAETGARETFLLARDDRAGAYILDTQDSSGQAALARADAIVRRAAGACAAEPGTQVDVLTL